MPASVQRLAGCPGGRRVVMPRPACGSNARSTESRSLRALLDGHERDKRAVSASEACGEQVAKPGCYRKRCRGSLTVLFDIRISPEPTPGCGRGDSNFGVACC